MIRGYSAHVEWSDADSAYVATCAEFPGLTGVDADAEVALTELREALEMAISVLEEDGEALPEPRPLVEHSGQFRLRVPKALHATLAQQAQEAGVSLNSYVVSCLAHSAGYTQAQSQVGAELQFLLREIRSEFARNFRPLERNAATNRFQPVDLQWGGGAAGTVPFADSPNG